MMPKRTNTSSNVMIGFAALVASSGAWAQTTVTSTPVGRLAVIREHHVREGTPDPHFPDTWKLNRIEWTSEDRRVRFFLEDNGGSLTAHYSVNDPGHQGDVCSGSGYPQAYQTRGPAERRWRRTLRKQFGRLLHYCEAWIDGAHRNAYLTEFAGAAGDFGAALQLMKQAATEDFGGWQRRCLRPRVDHNFAPFPRVTCVRESVEGK